MHVEQERHVDAALEQHRTGPVQGRVQIEERIAQRPRDREAGVFPGREEDHAAEYGRGHVNMGVQVLGDAREQFRDHHGRVGDGPQQPLRLGRGVERQIEADQGAALVVGMGNGRSQEFIGEGAAQFRVGLADQQQGLGPADLGQQKHGGQA